MDWVTSLFLFLFAFGLVFSIGTLFFSVADDFDLPGFGHHDPGIDNHSPSPLSLSTIMIFLTWFGAAGYIARTWGGWGLWLAAPLATAVGLIGGGMVWLFLAKVLYPGQTQLNPADYDLRGMSARVTSAIRAGGTGEIVYTIDNRRRTDGARSVANAAIPAGAEVVIVRYTDGLAYVTLPDQVTRDGPFVGDPVEELSLPPPT